MRNGPTHLPLTRRELLMAGAASAASAAAPDVIAQPAASPVSMAKVSLEVNGQVHALELDTRTSLLDALREQLQLTGSKKGCDQGQCGACTVIVDGKAVQSCDVPVSATTGKSITTIEGIGTAEAPHPLQRAFLQHQAGQCGYCLSGIIMSAKALLDSKPTATDADIRSALEGNLCRCGTHTRIIKAIRTAAGGKQ